VGDHRISWAIKAGFHGIGREYGTPDDMTWLNFSSTICEGVDDRVIEFFRELYNAGMEEFNEIMLKAIREERAADIERSERAQLAKLKAKYPDLSAP